MTNVLAHNMANKILIKARGSSLCSVAFGSNNIKDKHGGRTVHRKVMVVYSESTHSVTNRGAQQAALYVLIPSAAGRA